MSFIILPKNAAKDAVLIEQKSGTSSSIDDGGGSITVDGGVSVVNFPTVQPVNDAGGSITIDSDDGPIDVGNFPAVQPVSDNGGALTVDSDDGSISTYHKPDYSQLSTAGDPAPSTGNEGVTLEYTDTGDRFRWTGLIWVKTHSVGIEISREYFVEVVNGNVPGESPAYISGHDSAIGTTLATVGNNTGLLHTYSTSADIDSISSDNALDTHDITIIGLDINYDPVAPFTVTLNGQSRVALPTPLFRATAIINLTATPTLGSIWLYVNTAIAAGKPTDLTKIRKLIDIADPAGVSVSEEVSSSTSYTVQNGKSALVVFGKVTVSDAKAVELSLWRRLEGGVFTLIRNIDIKDNNYDYFFKIPGKMPSKTDIEVRAKVDSGTAHVSASIDLVLKDD